MPPVRNFRQEFNTYISQMEDLAAIGGVNGDPNHPLLRTLEALKQMLGATVTPQGQLKISALGPHPEGVAEHLFGLLRVQSHYGYDRMSWLADGYFQELLSDPQTQSFVRQRLPTYEHYDSTIAELLYWGWLKARGLTPKLTEDEGKPDLFVGLDEAGDEVHCDVKAVSSGAATSRIRKDIGKANQQIKTVSGDTTKGFCQIRIVEPVVRFPVIADSGRGFAVLQSEQENRNEAGVPNEIGRYYDEARRVMQSNDYKSIAKVVLTWEEHHIVGNVPGMITVVGNRKSCELEHLNARCPFKINADLQPKSTIAFNIEMRLSSA
jgi:hypothetical protein